jgi:hypothetical protein
LFYALYIFALSFLLGLVFPLDLINPNSLGIYYLLFILISITLYVLWVYRNSIYNIEDHFGLRSIWDEFKMFGFYLITVALICTTYLPFEGVYQYKMAHAIDNEEYVRELNVLNLADPFFVDDSYSYESTYIPNPADTTQTLTLYDYSQYKNWGHFTPSYYDSYGWIFGREYDNYNYNNKLILDGTWTDTVLEVKFAGLKNNSSVIKSLIADYIRIFQKYDRPINSSVDKVYSNYIRFVKLGKTTEVPEWQYLQENNYSKIDITSVYKNVAEAKFDKVYYNKGGYYVFLWYMVFYLIVFFMMFRNVKWQQFIITLVTLAILPLLILIPVSIIFRYSNEENIFTGICLLIYLGIFIYSIVFGISPPKKFTGFGSVLLQLSNILTPLAPLVFLYFAHRAFGAFQHVLEPASLYQYDVYYEGMTDHAVSVIKNYPDQFKECIYQHLLQNYWQEMYDKLLWISQVFGMVFYIFIYMPYMKEQFVRLKALPRKS